MFLSTKTTRPNVVIHKGTTALQIYCNGDGCFTDAPSISVYPFLRNTLVEFEWDNRRKKNFKKYAYYTYNKRTGQLCIPVNVLDNLIRYLDTNLLEYTIVDNPPSESQDITIINSGSYTDREDQIKPIEFLTNTDQYMKALELQTGCITGDTIIRFNRAKKEFKLNLKTAFEHFHNTKTSSSPDHVSSISAKVRSFTGKNIYFHGIEDIVYSGIKHVYKVTLENDLFLKCTIDHEIMTDRGFIPAQDIVGEFVMCDRGCSAIPYFSKAVSIEYVGEEETYDIVCKDPHHNFVANGIVIHNSGKSYIAVRSIIDIGKRALVIVPASLTVQWADNLTTICDAQLGVLRGSKTIMDIIKNNYETDVDIFLASITTLQEYALRTNVYNVFPEFSEFIERLRIGVKVFDECHLNFFASTNIDVQCNIHHNLYLSATYMRSSRNSQAIFRRVFPDHIKYGNDEEKVYDKYVNITECRYDVGVIPERYYSTDKGYSQFKYEKHLLRGVTKITSFINKVLYPVVEHYFIEKKRDNQKLLILVGLKEFAELVTQWFKDTYPDLRSIAFLHGVSDEMLEESDVIVSTLGSAGTGRDIKNLKTVILFTSFSSEAITLQSLGRLRKMEDTPEFVYLVNIRITSHMYHAAKRRPIYKHAGKTFNIVEV